jgi:hypothetical protein
MKLRARIRIIAPAWCLLSGATMVGVACSRSTPAAPGQSSEPPAPKSWTQPTIAGRADKPAPRTDANSMLAHEQLLAKRTQGRIDVYFVGNSITRRWGATDYPELLAIGAVHSRPRQTARGNRVVRVHRRKPSSKHVGADG